MHIKLQNDLERVFGFDPKMWEILRNKKIFATGCTGFIGSWIINSFLYINQKLDLGAELYCLTRSISKSKKKFSGIKFVEGDIQSFNFPEGQFDFVIHGATEVALYQHGDALGSLLDISCLGTKRVLEFAKSASVKKILFLSSGAAYGTQPIEMPLIEEKYLSTSLKSTYGEAKVSGEDLLLNENIPVTCARIFTACGPFLPIESRFAFSNFMESVILNKKILITSNGKTTRSYLYAGDLVLWLWILLLKGRDKEIYNVGSEEEISIFDLASKIKSTLDKNIEIEILGKESEFSRYIPSNKKIREEFNIVSLVPLELSIKKTYEFLKDDYEV